MKRDFDAVVIGAGHNGLAAAVHLAKRGWSVGVFERNPQVGGAVKTRELTLPGYRHDVCAMNLSMFAGSPFVREHGEALSRQGRAFAPAEHCFATPFVDGSWFGVSTSLDATLTRIKAFSDADAVSWQRLLDQFGKNAPHIFALLGSPMPSRGALKTIWRAWREMGSSWMFDTLRLLVSSPREWLDRNFETQNIKTALAAWGMHLDFAPDISGGALFPYLEAMANQAFGMVIGKGGADTIVNAMASYFAELGGEIVLEAPVASIVVENGRATGLRLEGGEEIRARKAVIANVVPQILFGKLMPHSSVAEDVSLLFRSFRPGPGTMMIHMALDSPLAWKASPELSKFAYVHLAPTMEHMSRAYAAAMEGLLPAEPVLVVGQPTAIDPSRAPNGKHILWVQVRVVPASIRGDVLGEISATTWTGAKEAYADRMVSLIESYAPGTQQKILARSVFSPADLETENPCLIGGDNLSGSHHLDQNFLFRPVAGYSRYKTPVAGLYMCGAATWPGAGTGAGSGYMLGKMLAR